MESFGQADSYETLFIFSDDGRQVSKAMLYTEFEAILDGVVGLSDLAGRDCRAAFVQVDGRLAPRAVVFFLIRFEPDGYADPGWNIPLRHIAAVANVGPDLGSGPIRIARRGDCAISWHKDQLWDPDVTTRSPTLKSIIDTLRSGRLGLFPCEPDEAEEPGADEILADSNAGQEEGEGSELQAGRIAALIRQQRERVERLNQQHEEELAELNEAHREQQERFHTEIQHLREQLAGQTERFLKLQERANARSTELRALQARLERRAGADSPETDVVSLKKHYRSRYESEAREQVSEVQQRLQTRESELAYQSEIEEQLRDEIRHLREEREQLVSGTADALLVRLQNLGVVFIAYHPGVGHLPIPLADIPAYMDNPQEYAAIKCNVEPAVYRQWVRHWENPRCSGYTEDGRLCQARIERIDKPAKYVHGRSNLCANCRQRSQGLSPSSLTALDG